MAGSERQSRSTPEEQTSVRREISGEQDRNTKHFGKHPAAINCNRRSRGQGIPARLTTTQNNTNPEPNQKADLKRSDKEFKELGRVGLAVNSR
jgi:hypothetical protein